LQEEFLSLKVVFLPGYACTSRIWQQVCDALRPDYGLTLIDWPLRSTPGFHDLTDFADWLFDCLGPDRCDVMVGHSLGGLVALQLLASGRIKIPKVILVETFLLPPDPFFQNLLLSRPSSTQEKMIREMLSHEETHYSPRLREAIRDVDMSGPVHRIGGTIHALYGDRGCGNPAVILEKLHLTEGISAHLEVRTIPGSCHFPMVENPAGTASVLRSIIDPWR
jgi:pimeloyl-ACP methyl ester carboxylesterase